MKKIFFLLFAALALFLCACSGDEAETSSTSESDIVVPGEGYAYTYGGSVYTAYDDEGRTSERIFYDYNGALVSSTSFIYDGEGTTVKEYEGGVLVAESFCTALNGTEIQTLYSDGIKTEYRYESAVLRSVTQYGEDGLTVLFTEFEADGTYSFTSYSGGLPTLKSVYDADGKQIKSVSYDTGGAISSYKVFAYGEDGKNNRIDSYGADGALLFSALYDYNADGSYKSLTLKDADGVITSLTEYGYDESGRQVTQIKYTYKDGNPVSYEKWVVDEHGNSVLEGVYDV